MKYNMKNILKQNPSKKELEELIELADSEIKEWKEFKKMCEGKFACG